MAALILWLSVNLCYCLSTGVMAEASHPQGYTNPPVFSACKPYDRWKIELEAWTKVTKLSKKQQGLAVALSFPEGSQVRDKVFSELEINQLDADDGIEKLISFLDGVYLQDELVRAYEAWSDFDKYRKSDNILMEDYIMEYKKLYNKVKKCGGTDISVPILAFKLLDGACLTQKDRQLVVTGVDFTKRPTLLDQVSTSLVKFFGKQTITPRDSETSSITVKMESTDAEALLTGPIFNKWCDNRMRRDGVEGSSQRGRQRARGPAYTRNTTEENWRGNPLDYQGKPTRCRICGSTYHYVRACPEKKSRRVFEVDSTRELNSGEPLRTGDDDYQVFKVNVGGLMAESFNCAILDSACTSTVCGKDWLDCYLDSLEKNMLSKVKEYTGEMWFRFGDGQTLKSLKQVLIPCVIAGQKCLLKTDVVDSEIPLLLGKPSMKKAKVKLDIGNDKINIFGKDVPV